MLLLREKSLLLIVDMQERILPAMNDSQGAIDRCLQLLGAARTLSIPILVSEQYPHGLGPTVSALRESAQGTPVFTKLHFSCAADPDIAAKVREFLASGRTQLVLAGIEAHVCVLQSALGFKEMGFDCFVATDATTSRARASIVVANDRLRSSGISLITTEMAVFEWLHTAGTPEFKYLSNLLK